MKAIVQSRYGMPDVLSLEEVEKPVPGEGQVLVKVRAVSLNGSDWEGLRGKPLYARLSGLREPSEKILGSDIAGRVEAVGQNAGQFQPGDEVYGEMAPYRGGLAEYACTSEKLLAKKPAGLTFEEAAAIPQAAVIALQALRGLETLGPGRSVLINGAGGSAGSFAVPLAKSYGAEVTGVDHAGKLDYLRRLGADHVIDYQRQDFTRTGQRYDLILDLIAHRPAFAYLRALKPGGSGLFVGGSLGTLFQILLLGKLLLRMTGKNVRLLVVRRSRKDLIEATELCQAGKMPVVIDRVFPLAGAPEALGYMGAGLNKGKVVISVE